MTELNRTPEAKAIAFTPEGQLLLSTAQRPAVQISELGDKSQLLAPAAERRRPSVSIPAVLPPFELTC